MPRYHRNWIHWCTLPRASGGGALVLAGSFLLRLNATAASVWTELESARGPEELFRRLRRVCTGVEDRRLRADLFGLLEQWTVQGLVAVRDDAVLGGAEDPWPV